MPANHRARLAQINRFDQLIAYLRDEMGWPIEQDSWDDPDLVFDFTPEELGIDPKTAVKIEHIKRLRPLAVDQPWGVFFIKFEPKRLPVVALRRILGAVALKKRESANSAERKAWSVEDLLFVSNYGEGDNRQITFAHFSHNTDKPDLPTLNVLGWDNRDTPLHLDAVAQQLTRNLAWPDEPSDLTEWRDRWRSAFSVRHREVITTARDLAIRLAELARAIRNRILSALAIESESGPLTRLMNAFQESLIHDLDDAKFADMYAQTIAYGLLSARIADPDANTADDFAKHMRTNPFLKELMETFLHVGGRRGRAGGPGLDFDELGVNDVVALLDAANMEAVIRDFGDRNPQEDPVIHFYESFLKEYDAKARMQRGVFYTPRPIVSYIVRSVDELLRTEVGLKDGLADVTTWGEMAQRNPDLEIPEGVDYDQPFVQILDPATGTGTFLVEIIDLIYATLTAKWKAAGYRDRKIQELWNDYVPTYLLPRLHGYELLMAPYAIAHLKIGLKLYETGYRFGSEQRARVYLTNALEPAKDFQREFEFGIPALAHEARAVNDVKKHQPFTVVVGNPPYSVLSSNNGDWIEKLLTDFRKVDGQPLGERNSQSLQDDYVKFFRLATHYIDRSGRGVLGFITPHGFLDNPTFRGMRQQLAGRFVNLRFLDLHGNVNKKEKCPDGSRDQNVFDILQGTAVSVLTKAGVQQTVHSATYAELWGDREAKYRTLATNSVLALSFREIAPQRPHFLFLPRDYRSYETFAKWPAITDLMPVSNNGLMTSRDRFVFGFNDTELLERLRDFTDGSLVEGFRRYGLRDVREMTIEQSQAALRRIGDLRTEIKPCLYRPLDVRRLFYHQCLVRWPVFDLMREMSDGKNLGLITSRMTKGETFAHVMVSRHPVEKIALSSKTSNNAYLFPLVIHRCDAADALFSENGRPSLNLSAKLIPDWFKRMGSSPAVAVEPDGTPNASATQVLSYFIAVLHSPSYRSRYAEFLSGEYPRLPLTGNLELFRALADLGGEVTALHLMESPKLDNLPKTYTGPPNPIVGKVGWSDETVWLDAGKTDARAGHRATRPGTIGFAPVPEEVWDFHIGGYQVCHKWLKDRKGRTLTAGDIAHYQKIVVALHETIRIMGEIDEVIEQHGGWPRAFQGAEANAETEDTDAS